MSHTWDPDRYLAYADERGRPFVDLLARVPAESPRVVVDLGCGPGNLTALLADRWRGAEVTGVDSSPEMIEAARGRRRRPLGGRRPARVGAPRPAGPARADRRARLQRHPPVGPGAPRPAAGPGRPAAPGGWFAFQVPGNFDEPSHTTRTDLAAREPYAEHVRDARVPTSHDPADYARVLLDLGCEVDAWETTYLHVLTGEDPVFDWVSGTGARPTLQALPDDLRPLFEDEFKSLLREAYPADAAGRVVMPFRRIFVVARKPQGVPVP